MQTELPDEGVTIGGPDPGRRVRAELRGVFVPVRVDPRPITFRSPETDFAATTFEAFEYRREYFRVGPYYAIFYLPCDGTPPESHTAECEAWLRENGPEPVRLYLAQLADQRAKVPCLIRIPAERVAEILGL